MGGTRYKTGDERVMLTGAGKKEIVGCFGPQRAVLILALLQWYRQARNVEEHRK